MKKFLTIFFLVITSGIAWQWLRCSPRDYPPTWDKLTVGMPHHEAEKLIPDLSESGMKGYWASSKTGWSLNVRFDKTLTIESITKNYTCEHHGIRNRMIFISKDKSFERKWKKDTPITP